MENQDSRTRLIYEQFQQLHVYVRHVTRHDKEKLKLIEINLLLGDMGKTIEARRQAQEHSIDEPDHDGFLKLCLEKCLQIFLTWQRLTFDQQNTLKSINALIPLVQFTEDYRQDKLVYQYNKQMTLIFNKVAGHVRDKAKSTDPLAITIDAQANISLAF